MVLFEANQRNLCIQCPGDCICKESFSQANDALKSVGVKVEMNTPRGVLEIHSPQNKHILLDDDLADLLGLKRRLQTIK